jgi:hypothetical protein
MNLISSQIYGHIFLVSSLSQNNTPIDNIIASAYMDIRKQLALLLILCSISAGILLWHSPREQMKEFSGWEEFDQFLLRQIQDFGHPVQRIRWRTIQVNDDFSRKVILVDIPQGFPQTHFHKIVADSLRNYGLQTWATVSFPDRFVHVHILQDDTIIRTIQFQRQTAGL